MCTKTKKIGKVWSHLILFFYLNSEFKDNYLDKASYLIGAKADGHFFLMPLRYHGYWKFVKFF